MIYEDLLTVPYKENGRDKTGMDCYGFVLELCRRAGTPLKDILYESSKADNFREYCAQANVREINNPVKGCLVEIIKDGTLHIGYQLKPKLTIHMTYSGVRITPTPALNVVKYYEVVNERADL